jgi:hypothetical protein
VETGGDDIIRDQREVFEMARDFGLFDQKRRELEARRQQNKRKYVPSLPQPHTTRVHLDL